ncbi:MAG: hypothetical protein GXY86_02915, partial [Firmicutes bacterium]|nr:hypothetical protein [Bacillota bacterium]
MKFKPIMLAVLLLSVIMIMNVGAAPVGDQEQITIAQVLASPNSQRVHPGVLLIDAKPETYWAVNPNSGEGWAELRLNQRALIRGLEISGSLGNGNSLVMEYRQEDGYWTTFLAGRLGSIPSNGIIDLSYDRIITGTIRLRIAGINPEQVQLNEVKVLGQPAQDVFHRINPRSVEASGHTSYLTRAEFLSDGNTNTYWMVKPRYRSGNNWLFETIETYLGIPIDNNYNFNWPNRPSYYNYGEVLFDLGEAQTITNINVFFTKDARGDLIVESDQGGKWTKLGVIPKPNQPGWQRMVLNRSAVSKIRLTLEATGHESVGGIGEVEFWGQGSYSGDRQLEIGPQNVPLTAPINREFKLKKENARDHRLDLAIDGSGQSPALELNGKQYIVTKRFDLNGHAIFSLPLIDTMLDDETNYLRIKPQSGTLTGLKLTHSGGGVQPHQTPALNDGLVLTPSSGAAEQIIQLNQKTLVEQVEIFRGETAPISLSYQNGNKWVTINPVVETPGYLRYYNSFTTGRIRINNPAGVEINEVRVLGSPITDQTPVVRLLRPEDYEVFDCDQLSDKYLVGYTDNPRATVKVNGKEVFQIGHYFGCHLTAIGIPTWEETEVEAVAVDPNGRVGRYKTRILIDKLPWFNIDQPESTVTTGNSTYQISGELKKPNSILKVNGQTVTGKTGRFTSQVVLAEGLNLIKIECVYEKPGSNSFTQTGYRKVVRQSGEIRLQVNAPLDGSRISAPTIIVSGNVYGSGNPKVWVGGKAAYVTGERFSATVALVEGKNEIEVTAQSGGASDSIRLTVWRDTVSPVLTVTAPTDQAIINNAAVAVTGTISDTSSVSVLVNGLLAEMTDGQFSRVLTLPEGWNQILVKAQDGAGNVSEKILKVMVDTEAPLPFTPTAEPSGWTNNNRPVISFATTDATSGVDHYEIRVGEGSWTTPVTGPYQFTTAIPDGEQTVQVKAVDQAGNETIGEVKVYIDTVDPAVPADFEVIPGINRAELRWEDPQGEVKGYRITRTPAFSEGAFKELFRKTDNNPLNNYIDPDLVSGAEYIYSLQAIDRAGNYSFKTIQIKVKAGEVSQEIGTEGGTVKFDNCELVIAEGAVLEQGRIVIKESNAALPENEFAVKTGPVYNFTFFNQSGEEVPIEFEEMVDLKINYADLKLSEGFEPSNLGIYWYNEEGEYWEKLEYLQIDLEQKNLTVPLNHFSDYQVMASDYASPSLDSYYDMGISPYQSYFRDNIEYVVPESGGLVISATDLRLPGRSGFDLIIKRIYDSIAEKQEKTINGNKKLNYKAPFDSFGNGWSLNIPWLELNDRGQFIRLPEGQTIYIEWKKKTFEYHEGTHFTLKKASEKYVLTLKDGTSYEFDKKGRPLRQIDSSGKNKIKYEYSDREITRITDSIGRIMQFTYSSFKKRRRITKIKVDNREIKYNYNDKQQLSGVEDPLGRKTGYIYDINNLKDITYPTGEVSSYKFEDKKVSKHTLSGKVTSYKYEMNEKPERNAPRNTYMYSCRITVGTKTIIKSFQQLEKKGKKIRLKTNPYYSYYRGNLQISERLLDNGVEKQRVTYEYNLPIRAITLGNHYHGGRYAYYTQNTYDSWGNLIKRIDDSRDLTETWSYHSHNRIKNLVGTHVRKNHNPVTEIDTTVTTTYTYDDTIGKPTKIKVDAGTDTLETSLTYDSYGNLKTKTEPNGLVSEIFYETGKNAFPERKVYYNIPNEAGVPSDISYYYGYNLDTGMKEWETDPRGFKTSYKYDDLNRVTRVTLPDDDQDDSNNPFRKYEFNDAENYCDFFNEKGQQTRFNFDGLGRLTEVIKHTDGERYSAQVSTGYHYDTLGRIDRVTDPMGRVTIYGYDGLNRVTQVTYPDNSFVTLEYDDVTNTVTITDEEGGKVTERSDWANRLVEAKQICRYPDTPEEIYTWTFAYDSLDNKVQQLDPLLQQVDLKYDFLGRLVETKLPAANLLVPGKTASEILRPVLKYEYDKMGNRTGETSANGNASGNPDKYKTEYKYDLLGRGTEVITKATELVNGTPVVHTYTTRHYYDTAGNKVKTILPNDKELTYTYSARGWLLSETDPLGNTIRYQYDVLGNKIAVTDPRSNGTDGKFTTWYVYDDLNRLYRTVLPDGTPPSDPYGNPSGYDNPYMEIAYDLVGNKIRERDANGVETGYEYDSRNRLVEVVDNRGRIQKTYTYDKKGHPTKVTDISNNTVTSAYDSLGRLRKVTDPLTNSEEYQYDAVGNKTAVTDARGNTTNCSYNSLGWLTGVRQPLGNFSQYRYDANGNLVESIAPNNLVTQVRYDEMNRLVETIDSLKNSTKYCYDPVGNKSWTRDRRGTEWNYQYYDNNLLKRAEATGVDGTTYWVEYTYDQAGNRQTVKDSGNEIKYNFEGDIYQPDPLNRINNINRSFDGASYGTAYRYNSAGLVTGIKYPEAAGWVEYQYNDLNQLAEVTGFTALQGISYHDDGALKGIDYANGAKAVYNYDTNRRLDDMKVIVGAQELLNLDYTYDEIGNVKTVIDNGKLKSYEYDKNNQLIKSVTPGIFMEPTPTPGTAALKVGDTLGNGVFEFTPILSGLMGLDYHASSIGIDFGIVAPGVKKIELVPDKDYSTHRINEDTIALYVSSDNINYTLIPKANWEYQKDDQGIITLTLKERLATRYLKLHVKFDERGWDFKPVNKATFLNEIAKMLRVYQEADSRTEEYQYDLAGNRKLLRVTLARTLDYNSQYYTNTDRLKTDGKYAFVYDEAGNMVKKGNTFTISGDTVIFTETSGEGVEYWEYSYDLLNRLIKVTKNGNIVAEYGYDPEGLRVVKKAKGETTHYVFEGTEPIFEKRISDGQIKSFVYALGKHLARVDGAIGDPEVKKYWYVTDHLGSVRAVTDIDGKQVWSADYLAFGTQYIKDGDFEELHSFTGKEFDPDTGLHYYNARWYDSELGRFVSEDPAGDPNNPNLYSYTGNNPLTRIDPTGEGWVSDTWSAITSFFSSLFGGENSNTGSIGGRPDVTPPPGSSSSESESDENDDIEGKKENVYVVDYDVQKQIQMDRRQLLDKVKEELDKAENAELGSEEWSQAMDNMAKYFEEIGILNGKEEYNMAAINLESARKTRRANPGKWKDAKEWYNQALDNLLDLAGYDQ